MIDALDDYPVVLQQEVIWGDMDAFGHVNNTVYFRYFEDVRMAYFDKVGVTLSGSESRLGPILASVCCDFRLPLEYPDRIHIAARFAIDGLKKIRVHHRVYSERFQAVAAEGEGLIVYFDYSRGGSCEIPESIRSAIEALESRAG